MFLETTPVSSRYLDISKIYRRPLNWKRHIGNYNQRRLKLRHIPLNRDRNVKQDANSFYSRFNRDGQKTFQHSCTFEYDLTSSQKMAFHAVQSLCGFCGNLLPNSVCMRGFPLSVLKRVVVQQLTVEYARLSRGISMVYYEALNGTKSSSIFQRAL